MYMYIYISLHSRAVLKLQKRMGWRACREPSGVPGPSGPLLCSPWCSEREVWAGWGPGRGQMGTEEQGAPQGRRNGAQETRG